MEDVDVAQSEAHMHLCFPLSGIPPAGSCGVSRLDEISPHVVKLSPEEKERRGRKRKWEEGQDAQAQVDPAEMGIVRDMRESITKVLGTELAPVEHQPPQATSEQLYPPRPRRDPFFRKDHQRSWM